MNGRVVIFTENSGRQICRAILSSATELSWELRLV